MNMNAESSMVGPLTLLQAPTPLRDSVLWQLQRKFYDATGVRCWTDNLVPNFVTSNAFVAAAYAKVILAFIRDHHSTPGADTSQPVHIIEMGAGHGKLSFLIARELLDMWQSWPGADAAARAAHSSDNGADADAAADDAAASQKQTDSRIAHGPHGIPCPFKLIITDVCEALADWWQSHESLAPLFEAGVVDCAIFDAEAAAASSASARGGASGGSGSAGSSTSAAASALPTELHLRHSGETLRPGSLSCPIVVVGNYVFDTLRQDAWRVDGTGQIYEGRLAVYASRPSPPGIMTPEQAAAASVAAADPVSLMAAPDVLTRCTAAWSWHAVQGGAAATYADEPELATAMAVYARRLAPAAAAVEAAHAANAAAAAAQGQAPPPPPSAPGIAFPVPIGGIRASRALTCLSSCPRSLLLCGDKAYNHEEELTAAPLCTRDPHIAAHGSFSFMVNFHAVRLWALGSGGFGLHTPSLDGFKVSAFILDAPAAAAAIRSGAAPRVDTVDGLEEAADVALPAWALGPYRRTLLAWAHAMEGFGPDDFATLQRCARDEIQDAAMTLPLAQSIIRMSRYDSDVFCKVSRTIIDGAPSAPPTTQSDIYRDVCRIYERFFPIQKSKDVAFDLGRVCMGLKRYAEAVQLFLASARHTGDHHVTSYNTGVCLYHLGQFEQSHACLLHTLELNPSYSDAAVWEGKARARLQTEALIAAGRRPAAAAAAQVSHRAAPSSAHGHAHGGVECTANHGSVGLFSSAGDEYDSEEEEDGNDADDSSTPFVAPP